ncbi:unnamed protein product, partial [Ranitomeya imitator]
DHEVITSLRNQQHKIRFSESVLTGSIIFPLSGQDGLYFEDILGAGGSRRDIRILEEAARYDWLQEGHNFMR